MPHRLWPALITTVCLGACSPPPAPGPSAAFEAARAKAAPAEREWRSYLGDLSSRQWSPLGEIDRANVATLQVAWEYASGGAGQIQTNPLIVGGVLFGVSPELAAFALDAATGEELWRFESRSAAGSTAPSRGLAWWSDGLEDERIFLPAGPDVWALDARSGQPIREFGKDGRIRLREGLAFGDDFVVATTPGAVFEDLLIQPMRVNEMAGAAPGDIRAFDVRTGEVRWTFRTIPAPGEPGHETWPPDAWQRVGGANNWAGLSIDTDRGIAYVPTGSAAFDFYGADRAGDNLFANTLLALDARTGERLWHYQVVRHDVWDRDLPAPPNLVTLEHDGERRDAVAQITKSGHVFVFDRETGEPIWPIEEVEAPGPGLPGEALAASQPLPTRPPPFSRQLVTEALLTTRTPEAEATAHERFRDVPPDHAFDPPSLEGGFVFPGIDGGGEWGGASFDPETGLLYVNSNEVPYWLQMMETPAMDSLGGGGRVAYVMVCASCHGLEREGAGFSPALSTLGERSGYLDTWRVIRDGRGRMPAFGGMLDASARASLVWYLFHPDGAELPPEEPPDEPALGMFLRFMNMGYPKWVDPDEALPLVAPPWGQLTAIDLNAGEIAWQVPLGNHPLLAERGVLGTGSENYGGPVATAGGLLFIAASMDGQARAFDKATGELLWEHELPFAGFATPAIYEADGAQYVVFASGGGKLGQPAGDRYVAFALPRQTAD